MSQQPLSSVGTVVARWADVGVAAVGLFILTGGPSSVLTQRFTTGGPDFEMWTYQYPFGAVGLTGAIMLGARCRWPVERLARLAILSIGGFVAWSLWSVSWSVIPTLTSTRAMVSAGVACFAVWFGLAVDPRRQRMAVGLATGAFVVASAFLVAFVPSYGRGVFRDNVSTERYRGLAANPNSLGPICVLAIVTAVSLFAATRSARVRVALGAVAICAVVLLIGSESDTALVALGTAIAMVGVIALVGLARTRGAPGQSVGVTVVAAGLVVMGACVRWMWTISEVLTGDSTFGNRRSIWTRVWDVIEFRPWRGWGYWSYWNVSGSGAVVRYGSAHNSVLEVWLGLGVIGVGLFALIVLLAVAGVAHRVWLMWDPVAWWAAVLLTSLLVGHLTESFVLWHSYNWAIVCGFAVGAWKVGETVQARTAPDAARLIVSAAPSSVVAKPSSPIRDS